MSLDMSWSQYINDMKKGNCQSPPLKIMHGGMADLQLPTQNYGDLLNGVRILASNYSRFGEGTDVPGTKGVP